MNSAPFLVIALGIAGVVWAVFYWHCRRRRQYLEQINGQPRIWARDFLLLEGRSLSPNQIVEACQEAAALSALADGGPAGAKVQAVKVTQYGGSLLLECAGLGRFRLVVRERNGAPALEMAVVGVPRALLALVPILFSAVVQPWPNALFLCVLPLPFVFDFGYSLSYLRLCLSKRLSCAEGYSGLTPNANAY